jgi:O-antigen ligase
MLVPNHSHNMAMQLWAETGAIGAGLLALTLVLAGWRLPTPASLGSRAGAVAGLIGAAGTIGAVSFDLWNEWWWAAISLLGVAALALCRSPQPNAPVETAVSRGVGPVH